MKIENKLDIYEIDEKELSIGDNRTMLVKSHWNDNDFVILETGNISWTVLAKQLRDAIDNAINWSK